MNDQVDRVRDAFNKLWADTDLGPQVRKKVKELYPDVALPEDAAEPVVAPLRAQLDRLEAENAKMREEREAEKAAAAERSAQQSINDRLDAARKRFNLTEEGFDKMVARMKETRGLCNKRRRLSLLGRISDRRTSISSARPRKTNASPSCTRIRWARSWIRNSATSPQTRTNTSGTRVSPERGLDRWLTQHPPWDLSQITG